jgi:transposase
LSQEKGQNHDWRSVSPAARRRDPKRSKKQLRLQTLPLDGRLASKAWYKRRNEIERLFRRLKGFHRIFSRFDKLDVMFMAFLCFALVVEALR